MLSQPTESRLQIWKLTPLRCFPEQVGSAGTASGFPVRGHWHRDQFQGDQVSDPCNPQHNGPPCNRRDGNCKCWHNDHSISTQIGNVVAICRAGRDLEQRKFETAIKTSHYCATAQPMKTNGNSPIRQTPFPGYICLALRDAIHTSIQSRETGLM